MVIAVCMFAVMNCGRTDGTSDPHGAHIDTLRVVTLYGPTSYFDYRGEEMGIDYENVRRFADEEGMVVEIRALTNINELIGALKSGEAHLAAYPVPIIAEYKEEVEYCGPVEVSRQLLVQRNTGERVEDVTQLVGKEVYVEKDSKYFYRLRNLNEELGGGIDVKYFDSDTIVAEDLLRKVALGEIDYAVVDSQTAFLYGTENRGLDLGLPLSSDQAGSWAVAPGLDSLAAKINRWENQTHSSDAVKEIYKRYYDKATSASFDANLSYFKKLGLEKGGKVSDYDGLFKTYAPLARADWELLAAIAFCESRFNPSVESRFGAYGLMQVMPSTASAMGIDPSGLSSPDINVKAAAKILAKLDDSLKGKVEDPEERKKFVVAAYNSGLGHVYDAIALAEKVGLDPQKWTGNVSIAALMKSRPEYYNDPVVKHGYFRGRETVDFVDHVSSIERYLQSFKNKS